MENYVPGRISVIQARQWVRFLDGLCYRQVVNFLGKALWIHERVCERELLCVVHNKMFKYSLPFLESFSGKDRKNNVTPRL